jgi:hypothetical protein
VQGRLGWHQLQWCARISLSTFRSAYIRTSVPDECGVQRLPAVGPTRRTRRGRGWGGAEHDMPQRWRNGLQQSSSLRRNQCAVVQYSPAAACSLLRCADQGIIDLLPDRPPQVTFSCNKPDATCDFQFWVDQVESFYCGLDTCRSSVRYEYGSNITSYDCEHLKCSCIPDRFLCGENGSVGASPPYCPQTRDSRVTSRSAASD